ncbi:hypothetical protein P167DRAFT_533989 [Morchella conica CCBAS932]|uniref:DUF1773 domain-containing protein n=1 Tax=Morchella conica CCBAS932 TaxID=1392247 RepID=A0A3N4KYR5_9PEZI|nr:hypothetical protein P167DRAFT_533989 [Morchella conica CCBAS932]
MADLEPPNFVAMAENLNHLSHHVSRMQNIPAVDAGVHIAQAIMALSRRMEDRFDEINRRFDETNRRFDETNRRLDSMEFNSMARLANFYATHSTTPLSPLRDAQNQDIANFPFNEAAIDALNGNGLNVLLNAYGLPVTGNLALRKQRFKAFIGIVALVMPRG